MTQELTQKPTVVSDEMPRVSAAKAPWHRFALAAILLLSGFLNLFHLTYEGYGIAYYSAAVKNMLTSLHNFFFVSFDAGFVSVDKPPLGLWIQAASAWLFGFHGLSLMLPQAVAGTLCVALLYHLVRRSFGPVAGLIAGLVLAVTPIFVATSRNNTMDMLLVLTVLVAAWAVSRATENGRLRWFLLGAVVVGLGFNIKMLEAFLVLPAFYLLYLLAAPLTLRRRFVHLGVATLVLLAVSLSWAVAVDLTPADQRPYVGSTSNDTVTNLILGYNGIDRLIGTSFGAEGEMPAGTLGGPGAGALTNGEPGPFRLLNQHYAGQIGWLLPLAVVGLLATRQRRPRLPLYRSQQALVLWGAWFLTAAAYFSVAGGQHLYYTVMLAPALAALAGTGVVELWKDYRNSDQDWWLLPLSLVIMAILHAHILAGYEGWNLILTPVIIGLCLIMAAVLVVLRLKPKPKIGAHAAAATTLGILALLIAPTVWASYQVFEGPRSSMPIAGPPRQALADGFAAANAQGGFGTSNARGINGIPPRLGNPGSLPPAGGPASGGTPSDDLRDTADPALMNFLLANKGDAKYLVAATRSRNAAPIILSTDEPVISLGGYNGIDPVFTHKQLSELVKEGAVRFFLIPDSQSKTHLKPGNVVSSQPTGLQGVPLGNSQGSLEGGPTTIPNDTQNESAGWVQGNCKRVPQELWQSPDVVQRAASSTKIPPALYDCGADEK